MWFADCATCVFEGDEAWGLVIESELVGFGLWGMGDLYDVVEDTRLTTGKRGQRLKLHGVVARSFTRVGDWNLRKLVRSDKGPSASDKTRSRYREFSIVKPLTHILSTQYAVRSPLLYVMSSLP